LATITDQLITVFKAVGADEYRRALDQAAESAKKLAREEKKKEQETPVGPQAARIANLAVKIGALSLAYQGLRQVLADVAQVASAPIRAFAEQESAVFRMQLVLRNLGRASEVAGLDAFNRQLASTTGQTTQALSQLTALLTQFNLTDEEIRRSTPVLIDWATAVGIDLPRAADILGSALRNEKDAIQRYGVDIDLTRSRSEKLNQALEQLQARFRGGAEAAQGTLIGSLTRLNNSFQELLATMGRLFGPPLVAIIRFLTASIEGWTLAFKAILATLERIGIISPVGAAAERVGGANASALRGDPAADSANLEEIKRNTKQTADALVKQVLGGTLPGGALNIRGLNAALRAAR
jgi:hypothetical protein